MRRMFSKNQLEELAIRTIENTAINSNQVINSPYEEVSNIYFTEGWLNGLSVKNLYGKVIKENNILFLVLSCQLANETESEISTLTGVSIAGFTIPASIGDKIYRKDGSKVSQAWTSGDDITGLSLKLSSPNSGGIESRICNLYSGSPNSLAIYANSNTGTLTVSANGTLNIDLRVFLVL